MAKVADVKLGWTKSPSADVSKVEISVTINGAETKTEIDPAAESFMVVVRAGGVVSFTIATFDSEGNQATSEVYTFTLGDLESPLPATNLFHEVVGVRDEGVVEDRAKPKEKR
jgi:hypothetical protein